MMALFEWIAGLPRLERFSIEMMLASTVCGGAVWGLVRLLKRRSAALRGSIWTAGFFAMAAFGLVRLTGLAVPLPVIPAQAAVSEVLFREPKPTALSPRPESNSDAVALAAHAEASPRNLPATLFREHWKFADVTRIWAVVWVAGAGCLLIRMVCGVAALLVCARSARRPTHGANLTRVLAQMPEAARCELRLHPGALSPVCFGFVKTWIVLPPQAERWSEERLRFVLHHELAHGERGDYAATCLIRAVTALCWPNPVVWLGQRQFRRLCEEAVDDRVASRTHRIGYAEELLRILQELRRPARGFKAALSMAGVSSPRSRIGRLLDDLIDHTSPSRRQVTLVIAAGLCLAVSGGALRLVRAESAAPAAASSGEESAWMEKLKSLRAQNPEDSADWAEREKSPKAFWEKYWAETYPRLWQLVMTGKEFLRRFPDSAQAFDVRKEMIDAAIQCLNEDGSIGKQSLDWVSETLTRPDLSPAIALPFYSYQANMIGIMSGGGNIDSLVPVPRNSQDIAEALEELVESFAKRFPGTPELGALYLNASHFLEKDDRLKALGYLDRARSLVKDANRRNEIEGAQFRLTAEGKPAPTLSFVALDGRKVDLAALKGKVVLLDFWATWCGPCVAEMPEILAIQKRWEERGLEVIGISLDSSREALLTFLAKNKLPWPQYFDGKGWDNEVARGFGVTSIPSAWVIDQKGVIVAVNPEQPVPVLERLLGSGDAPAVAANDGAASTAARQRGTGTMTVRVVDADGKPVAGAAVRHSVWTDEKFKRNADYITDSKGEATFKLPRTMQILRLWVSKDSHVPLFANWEPRPDNVVAFPEQATFTLAKGAQIGGVVVDEDGTPIPGAKVEIAVEEGSPNDFSGRSEVSRWLAFGDAALVTNSQGRWLLDNAPTGKDAEFSIKLSHRDFVADKVWGAYQKNQHVTTEQFRARTARIAMARGISLSGLITDPSGKPVEKAVVIRGDDPYQDEGGQEVLTDATGRYHLPPLPPGPLTLTVAASGWSPEQKEIVIAPSPRPMNFSLKLGKTLHIQFVDGEGKPVPNVGVSLQTWRRNRALYNVRHSTVVNTCIPNHADKNGIYEWTWAPDDPAKYTFWKDGYQSVKNQMLAPGEYRIVLSK